MKMNKDTRQKRILSLIRAKPIGTQDELRSLLAGRGARDAVSVSRDLGSWALLSITALHAAANGAAARDS